jgi:rSAM/selenodomain-associated transferase 2
VRVAGGRGSMPMSRSGKAANSGATLLSVVIPTLNEEPHLGALLEDLRRLRVAKEIIVVDGGSRDGTTGVAASAQARVLSAPAGRGSQLRIGADAATGQILCFLHADTRLDARATDELADLARGPLPHALAFRLRIDSPRPAFRILEGGANLRSRLLGLPYGDQGLIVSRAAYEAAGGYPAIPIMEDVVLARRLHRSVGVRLLRGRAVVSARRWERDGVARRTLTNLGLLFGFLTGTPPDVLARRYRPERPRGES